MKYFITTATAVILAMTFSHSAFTHSHLDGSNPADGEVVTETLNEIILEFDGKIEEGSFIELASTSGQAFEIQDIFIGEGTLTGTVAEPLPNNDYQVNWSIVSADGHPLNGEITFTVNAPVSEAEKEVSEEASETTETDNQSTESQEETATDEEEDESSFTTIMIIVLLMVIIAGGLFFFIKKRK